MDTLAGTSTFRHTTIRVDTKEPTQFIDITDQLESIVVAAAVDTGVVNIQTLHTTTAIIVNEHDPLLMSDVATLLERAAPREAVYRHDNVTLRSVNCVLGDRPNGHSHCRALLLGPTVALNVSGGQLQLGRWQRVFVVELDGPRSRDVSVLVVGESGQSPA
jgi:secondary thiamine-phosphate synthase enzyme